GGGGPVATRSWRDSPRAAARGGESSIVETPSAASVLVASPSSPTASAAIDRDRRILSSARPHGDFGDLGRRRRHTLAWTRRHAGRRFERDDADVEGNARAGGGRGHGEIFRKRHGERGGTMHVMAEDGDPPRVGRTAPALR